MAFGDAFSKITSCVFSDSNGYLCVARCTLGALKQLYGLLYVLKEFLQHTYQFTTELPERRNLFLVIPPQHLREPLGTPEHYVVLALLLHQQ